MTGKRDVCLRCGDHRGPRGETCGSCGARWIPISVPTRRRRRVMELALESIVVLSLVTMVSLGVGTGVLVVWAGASTAPAAMTNLGTDTSHGRSSGSSAADANTTS